MEADSKKLLTLINGAQNILITSHLGPDADSLCSSLLLAQILNTNFSDKHVIVCMEEEIRTLVFLDGYDTIKFDPLSIALKNYGTQLLIILDANNISRCTREPEPARLYMKEHGVKLAVIDHHEPIDIEPNSLYINQNSPAVTEDVYEICFNELKLAKPKNYAQTAMVGLYADTGGFTYDNPRRRDTFKMASQLMDDGGSAELAANQLNQYTSEGLEVLSELIKNIRQTQDYTYTYISDEFYGGWLAEDKPADAIHEGVDIFQHGFVRNVNGRSWGYAVYPDQKAKTKTYSVSFRSLQGEVDVSAYARKLGGGGHKPAAGAKIEASTVGEAIAKIKNVINGSGS
ncbi:MAG TPA: DHH family phosphoesterase [Candidatus Saccharimonadales bacterium]|nr:DHH family phosphoesterase [Candidatus Saccharimonadales bacterium]